MIKIYANSNCGQEKKYIFNQIFTKFLRIPFEIIFNEKQQNIKLAIEDKEIEINNEFFEQFEELEWLSEDSLPKRPLNEFSKETEGLKFNVENGLPIIYGNCEIQVSERKIYLGLDVFGSCFFMLSRYEEVVIKEKDAHGRFPVNFSLAYQESFLLQPIVDEYIEILWNSIHYLCPEIPRGVIQNKTYISCDVDFIQDEGVRFPGIIKRLGSDLLIKKSVKSFLNSIRTFFLVSVLKKTEYDPFNTFDFMMDLCEKQNLKIAFYFIPRNNKKPIDGNYNINSNDSILLMKKIAERGHEIGYHASYYSYNDKIKTKNEISLLRNLYTRIGGNSKMILGGRQHYLRWETGITEKNWEHAGMQYDSTLGYAEHIGFRCGTSKEYNFYDLIDREPLNLIIRPLIIMEVSLFNENYMNLNLKEAEEHVLLLVEKVKKYSGNYTLLWHNSSFYHKEYKVFFENIIKLNLN